LQNTLPCEFSHRKMLPMHRELTPSSYEIDKLKHSSVLLLIFRENNEHFILLIKRTLHMKHHAGQIAFPGGRIEVGESALETALRETYEEIGIDKNRITILGSLSDIYVQVSQFVIHPFVGWIDNKSNIIIDKNEVEKVVYFPIVALNNEIEEVELETISGILKVPCIKHENEIIWGATSMILAEFKDVMANYSITLR